MSTGRRYQPVVTMGGRIVAVAADGPDLLEPACGHLAAWRRRPGWEDLTATISVSRGDLSGPELGERLAAVLSGYGFPPGTVTLNTDYPSLLGRKDLPFQTVTIERCVVAGLRCNEVDRAIAASLVGLAHQLGLRAVADGVERVDQLDILRELDCDLARGCYWSPPVGPEDFGRLLDDWVATGLPITATR